MPQEIEAKFALSHLGDFRQQLLNAGARHLRDRVLERNWRFDNQDGSLTAAHQVLRLRIDIGATLTFKQPGPNRQVRDEIEFEVGDHTAVRELLVALGYHVILVYEKYRETFRYGSAKIDLDELPFGNFVEIETVDQSDLKPIAEQLGFDWGARVPMSYAEIFKRWQADTGHQLRDATFTAFADLPTVQLADLGLQDSRAKGAIEAADQ